MKCKLSDVMTIIGGGTPKTTKPEFWNGDIPWLSVKDFNNDNRYVYTTEKSITQLGLDNSSTKLLDRGDVIISARGTVGELASIPFPMAFNQSCYGLRANPDIITHDYLYYLVKYNVVLLKKKTHGSVFDTITRDTFDGIEIDIPSSESQKKIGGMLSDIDEKIYLNQKINDNLEQQLASLYGEMIKCNGQIQTVELSKLCSFQEGYVNPVQTHPEYFDGNVKWLRAVDINESFIIDTSRTLTTAGFESAKKSALLFKPDTIAISKSGTIGRLGIVADYMCGNRAVINIAPRNPEYLPFVYCYLKSKQREFPEIAVGSVQKNLYISVLEPLCVSMPDNETLQCFCKAGNKILQMMKNLCVENDKLSTLRDTLLPKLMSGEIDVCNIEI